MLYSHLLTEDGAAGSASLILGKNLGVHHLSLSADLADLLYYWVLEPLVRRMMISLPLTWHPQHLCCVVHHQSLVLTSGVTSGVLVDI